MKIHSRLAICAIAFLLAHAARAGDADVTISSEPKKFDQKANSSQNSDITSKTEDWGYSVTVQNSTFKPLANLEVKYIIFYKHSQLGIKAPPKKMKASGSFTIQSIASQDKQSFQTDPVKLTKAAPDGKRQAAARPRAAARPHKAPQSSPKNVRRVTAITPKAASPVRLWAAG